MPVTNYSPSDKTPTLSEDTPSRFVFYHANNDTKNIRPMSRFEEKQQPVRKCIDDFNSSSDSYLKDSNEDDMPMIEDQVNDHVKLGETPSVNCR